MMKGEVQNEEKESIRLRNVKIPKSMMIEVTMKRMVDVQKALVKRGNLKNIIKNLISAIKSIGIPRKNTKKGAEAEAELEVGIDINNQEVDYIDFFSF